MTLPIPASLDFVQIALGVGAFLLSLRVPVLAPWLAPLLPRLGGVPLPVPAPATPASPAHPLAPADLLAGIRDVIKAELHNLIGPHDVVAADPGPSPVLLPHVPGSWSANDDGTWKWTPPGGPGRPQRPVGFAAAVSAVKA